MNDVPLRNKSFLDTKGYDDIIVMEELRMELEFSRSLPLPQSFFKSLQI